MRFKIICIVLVGLIVAMAFFVGRTEQTMPVGSRSVAQSSMPAFNMPSHVWLPSYDAVFFASTVQRTSQVKPEEDMVAEAMAYSNQLHKQQQNIFFKESEYIRDILELEPNLVQSLELLLNQQIDDAVLSNDLLIQPSGVVMGRMAAIDLLELIAFYGDDIAVQDAVDVLRNMVESELDKHLSTVVKRVVVSEKYDALVALLRTRPQIAFEVFHQIDNLPLAQILSSAMIAGLVDIGMSSNEALQTVEQIRHEG